MRKFAFVVAIVFAVAVFALGANQALANGGHYHHGYYYPHVYGGYYGSWYAAPSVVVVPTNPAPPAVVVPTPVVPSYSVSPAVVVPAPVVVRPRYRCYW